MLKGIHPAIGPDLLAGLARMGHSDQLAVVDRNYPSYSSGAIVIETPGYTTTELLPILLTLLPLDDFVTEPIRFMIDPAGSPSDAQQAFLNLAADVERRAFSGEGVPRERFYEEARSAHIVIATSDPRPYTCFLLAKGVINDVSSLPSAGREGGAHV